jgi:hypothetical protein
VRAGSRRVVELHGTMRRVLCTHCGQVFDRRDLAVRVEHDNPWITVPDAVELGPDGDVLPSSSDGFVCRSAACAMACSSRTSSSSASTSPPQVHRGRATRRGERCSPHRRFLAGRELRHPSSRARAARKLPVVIVNRGETRGDNRATVKVDAGTTEVLRALARALPAAE